MPAAIPGEWQQATFPLSIEESHENFYVGARFQ